GLDAAAPVAAFQPAVAPAPPAAKAPVAKPAVQPAPVATTRGKPKRLLLAGVDDAPSVRPSAAKPVALATPLPAKPQPGGTRARTGRGPQLTPGDDGDTVVVAGARYAIQVGAYSKLALARQAAQRATRQSPALLRGTHLAIDEKPGDSGKIYRARIAGLTQA